MSKEDFNLPPFYVGQRVVALETSEKRFGMQVIKGHFYTVAEQVFCCGRWTIGCKELKNNQPNPCLCHIDSKGYGGGYASKFAPIQENFQSISLEKILQEETKLISVN